jgi:hypothetical protein
MLYKYARLFACLLALNSSKLEAAPPEPQQGRLLLGLGQGLSLMPASVFSHVFLPPTGDATLLVTVFKFGYEHAFGRHFTMTPQLNVSYSKDTIRYSGYFWEQTDIFKIAVELGSDFNYYPEGARDLRLYGNLGVGYRYVESEINARDYSTFQSIDFVTEIGLGYQFTELFELAFGIGTAIGADIKEKANISFNFYL